MKINPAVLWALAWAVLLTPLTAHAAITSADVVNVDFNTTDHGSAEFSGLAAGPVTAGTKWNPVALGPKLPNFPNLGPTHNFGPTTAGTLVDSASASTSLAAALTLTLNDIRQYMTDENPLSDAAGGRLLNDYPYRPDDVSSSSLTIGGVPAGTYDLYLYSQNGNYGNTPATAAITNFTVNGVPQTANNSNASSGVFTLNRNYVLYSGIIVPNDNPTITVAFDNTLNGFQLVQTAVPEPASLAIIIGLIALPLLARRDR